MTEWGLGVRYYLTLNQTLCVICLLVRRSHANVYPLSAATLLRRFS